eukprot:gene11869-12013_t
MDAGGSPRPTDQPPPGVSFTNPFARARSMMAQREVDQLARCKEDLMYKDKQVRELTTQVAKADSQLHGLQTVLAAKHGTCSRLESELRTTAQQLKQAQATNSAAVEALKKQLVSAQESVLGLQQQLSAAQQREHQLLREMQAVRAKLAQVLEAVVLDAEDLAKHQSQQPMLTMSSIPSLVEAAGGVAPDMPVVHGQVADAAHAGLPSSSAAALTSMGTNTGTGDPRCSYSRTGAGCSTGLTQEVAVVTPAIADHAATNAAGGLMLDALLRGRCHCGIEVDQAARLILNSHDSSRCPEYMVSEIGTSSAALLPADVCGTLHGGCPVPAGRPAGYEDAAGAAWPFLTAGASHPVISLQLPRPWHISRPSNATEDGTGAAANLVEVLESTRGFGDSRIRKHDSLSATATTTAVTRAEAGPSSSGDLPETTSCTVSDADHHSAYTEGWTSAGLGRVHIKLEAVKDLLRKLRQ